MIPKNTIPEHLYCLHKKHKELETINPIKFNKVLQIVELLSILGRTKTTNMALLVIYRKYYLENKHQALENRILSEREAHQELDELWNNYIDIHLPTYQSIIA